MNLESMTLPQALKLAVGYTLVSVEKPFQKVLMRSPIGILVQVDAWGVIKRVQES